MRIDAHQAVKYILRRHSKHRSFKIVDTCVQELQKTAGQVTHKERTHLEKNVHLFLHEIFLINKEMSRQYHEKQIDLYIKFDQAKLLSFLMATDVYQPHKAAEKCQDAGLYREQAYLLFKTGNAEEAIQVLIEKCCDNLAGVIELAV